MGGEGRRGLDPIGNVAGLAGLLRKLHITQRFELPLESNGKPSSIPVILCLVLPTSHFMWVYETKKAKRGSARVPPSPLRGRGGWFWDQGMRGMRRKGLEQVATVLGNPAAEGHFCLDHPDVV